ncbi:hypothetical protein BVC80_9069g66 [Macleaya cordata]|uniref:OVATE domain-containing protein n=1 Tax=Macleaya cordata TaxID=56857 RepID=A0A200PP24_MACCD|nr:hypothetical protein BVC80_9069g66 [Macleaya cordata]
MLLRNTFSNTKKFFSKTFQNFKSLVSGGGYQRLPKTPPFNDHHHQYFKTHQSFREFDNIYTEFSNRSSWEDQSDQNKTIKKRNKKKTTLIMDHEKEPMMNNHAEEEEVYNGSFMKFANNQNPVTEEDIEKQKKQRSSSHGSTGRYQGVNDDQTERIREQGRNNLVKQKMKELVMMDMRNMDHVMDVEEMIYYYSHLTCPVYLDIIDKFFMELYSEFFLINSPTNII